MAVGAPHARSFSRASGSFFVLLLNADGSVRATREIGAGLGNFAGTLGFQARFGWGLAGLGDLDGDGRVELAVSAPYPDGVGVTSGELYVLTLETDGSVGAETRIASGAGGFPANLGFGDLFGLALAAPGDVDGDGTTDLALTLGRSGSMGSFGVAFLNPDGSVRAWLETDPRSGPFPGYTGTPHSLDTLRSLAPLGDLDGDGVLDLLLGSERVMWSVFLRTDGSVRSAVPFGASVGGFVGHGPTSGLGFSAAFLGDRDGDGRIEAAVGTPFDLATTGTALGSLWIVSLESDGGDVQGVPPGSKTEGDPLAFVVVRSGNGANPQALAASDRPILGAANQLTLDTELAGGSGPSVLLITPGSLPGVNAVLGELLIDLSSSVLFSAVVVGAPIALFDVPVPDDDALLGVVVQGQAAALTPGGYRLTNALALHLGR